MIETLLASCLGPVVAAEKRVRRRTLAISMLLAATLACLVFLLLAVQFSWWSWPAVLGAFGALALASLVGSVVVERRGPDLRLVARRIEEAHPDLRAALLAAMDQRPGPDGELGYLQRRLLGEISEHALRHRWVRQVSNRRLLATAWGQFGAIAAFFVALWFLLGEAPSARPGSLADAAEAPEAVPTPAETGPKVSPGDVELEKGSRLVVEASFDGAAPAAATLVHRHGGGETRLAMEAGLDEGVLSALVPQVDTDGSYEVVYGDRASERYAISVFEYPELVQADAVVTGPDYLGGAVETILDIRKVSVMEGSRIDWRLRVNKPLAAAELFGEDGEILALAPDPADPTLLLASHAPAKSQRYRVHLIDEKDRSNRRPPWLAVTVKENLPPKLKLTFPGRDFDVSALQELPLEAEVWDDVEVLRSGMSYLYQGEETEVVLTDAPLAGQATHPLATLIDIEALGAKERDLVSYYFWAEDRDKDGQVRRSASDRFFAEVRLFEDIVREGAPGGGQGGTPQSGQSAELLRLQKDIVNAAWKLVRDHELGKELDRIADDVEVVRESQGVAVAKLDEALGQVEDAAMREFLSAARGHMERAGAEFGEVLEKRDGGLLVAAMGSATAAYEELVKARARETEVTMSRNPSQGGQPQESEQRMMNLELEQKELKYEEQSMAESPAMSAEQQENLAVLNRLKDLARRQEAIAEKIKELENQLQNAREEDKDEIERQLKRLQEEQRELLRELDELDERMDSEENRADMSEAREDLEETRESVRETAEQLEDGRLADAANSATRAGEQLEQIQEEFRERTSRQFANEMKGLRDAARELGERQQAIDERLESLADAPEGEGDLERRLELGEMAQSVNEQSTKLAETLESMRRLSEQAEASEPLLSDALYEAVRNAQMNDLEKSLEEVRDLSFYNRPDQARAANAAASRGIDELKDRIEKAAEKILGNEADALRLARSELDKLIEESKAESERLAAGEGDEEGASRTEEGRAEDPTGSGRGREPGEGAEAPEQELAEAGQGKGKDKGKGKGSSEDSEEPGESEGGERGQADAKGKGKGKGEATGEGEEGEGAGELAEAGKGEGEGEGKGKGEGREPGEGEGGDSEQAGTKGKGKGKGEGRGEGTAEGLAEGGPEGRQAGSRMQASSGRGGGVSNFGDDRGGGLPTGGDLGGPLFFDEAAERREAGPITGEDYANWSDRLGNIEEMIPQEDLRNDLARVRDEARSMRLDYRRDGSPPGAATIDQRITRPLLELRQRIGEELAKLNRENPVAPIDRDPVPSEFRDLVRRYYEELGSGE